MTAEMLKKDLNKLNVTLYGACQQVTPTLSKCRVRIFYRGLNRNRTFITEDFANQLKNSLPYTPIKGIFDEEEMEFLDHGRSSRDGRIFGVVTENPNASWETHVDKDGVSREYLCADVLLFTGLYKEAKLILDSPQSMELFPDTLKGEWKIGEDDMPYYEFYEG